MPPVRSTTRNIQLFAVHVRLPTGRTNYADVLNTVAAVPARDRIVTFANNKVLALSAFDVYGMQARLIAHEGEQGDLPLIFNTRTAQDRVGRLRDEEILAHKTHCIIDAAKRIAVIEYNHRGAKSERIGEALEMLLRTNPRYAGVTVELNPQADESFIAAIDRFERVKVASLKIARPNLDWNDHYNNLSAIGADSEGEKVEVVVSAARSQSLAREAGVVQYIKTLAREGLSVLKGARVHGVREGETASTTVSLSHFIKHQRVHVKVGAGNQVDDQDLFSKMSDFLGAQAERSADA